MKQLTKDEIALLLNSKSNSDIVQKIYEISKELIEENMDIQEALEEVLDEIKQEVDTVVEEKGTQKSIFDY